MMQRLRARRRVSRVVPRLLPALAITLVAMLGTHAFAQGGATTSSLSGVVSDASGAMLPGVTVTIKHDATAATFSAVTTDKGYFQIPSIPSGTYTATVTLNGFKQAVVPRVVVNTGSPASLKVALEMGNREETVTVEGGAEILQTQSSTIATTMNLNEVSNLPLVSRNAMDFITMLPGVQTPGGNRDSIVNGLPQNAINITIDGLNVQDNYLKSGDGFFALIAPRLDAVQEVTLTSAAQGADSTGQGAVQIRFETRSGTNQLQGSVYHYFRHKVLNANDWFSNRDLAPDPATGKAPRPDLVQNQPGFRVGGPIVIPGLWNGHDKGFFFINYEEFRQPSDQIRNRTILSPEAQRGIFRYNVTVNGQTQVRELNLLALAAANGLTTTIDPTIAKLLADIRASTGNQGISNLADPNLQRFTFQNDVRFLNRFPTGRFDFNLTDKHRLTASFTRHTYLSDPDTLNNRDPNFPGAPVHGSQDSVRWTGILGLRSSLGANLVNDLRFGALGGPVNFSATLNPSMYGGGSTFDQGGYLLAISAAGITNATSNGTPSSREATERLLEDSVTWVRGSHSMSFGTTLSQYDVWVRDQTVIPTINFGITTGDPADAVFTTANLGLSGADLTNARNLYAVLTGRVNGITGNARLDELSNIYNYLGAGIQRARMREMGVFAQDSWRLRSNLTLNLGLRWELQLPFEPLNSSYSYATIEDVWGVSGVNNLFKPGVLEGKKPVFNQLAKGTKAYNIDWNNLAPSLGFTWRPRVGGFLRFLLSDEPVIRGGFSLAYQRGGLNDFTALFGANPGQAITVSRSQALGNLGPVPLFLSQRDLLGPPSFANTPVFPYTELITNDINAFDQNFQTPYAETWTAGFQRRLTKDMRLGVHYVGTRNLQGLIDYNFNETNIVENGFLNEFRLAQANLQANIAAGRGATFRYFGPGTGTSPLPTFLAFFSGIPVARAGDASLYNSALFTNATFVNPLAVFNPNPFTAAQQLYNDATRRNNAYVLAGLPVNFFLANPDQLGGAFLRSNGGYTRYDSLQIDVNRRLTAGLQVQGSYVFAKTYESARYSLRKPRRKVINGGAEGGIEHAFKADWVYELPFGKDRRFFSGSTGFLNGLVGGWSFAGTARIQSGRLLDFGNVRLVGMTKDDVRKMFNLRYGSDGKVYMLPQDVIDNTLKAFSVSATSPTGYGTLGAPSGRYFAPANGPDCIEIAAGYGDCGVGNVYVTGPMYRRFDLALVKRIPLKKRLNFELRVEMLNAFNNVNFIPVTGAGNNPVNYEVTSDIDGPRIVQIGSRISW